jgi:hypothetical protein
MDPPPTEEQAASRADIEAAAAARTARPRAPPCLVVDCIYLFPWHRTQLYISVVAFWRHDG